LQKLYFFWNSIVVLQLGWHVWRCDSAWAPFYKTKHINLVKC
jgi:hypothetical protein